MISEKLSIKKSLGPDKDKFGSGTERQWDCLHDENYADGCLDQAYRLLNF